MSKKWNLVDVMEYKEDKEVTFVLVSNDATIEVTYDKLLHIKESETIVNNESIEAFRVCTFTMTQVREKAMKKRKFAKLTISKVLKRLISHKGPCYTIHIPCPCCGKFTIQAKDDSLTECYCMTCERDVFSISFTYHTEDEEIVVKGW